MSGHCNSLLVDDMYHLISDFVDNTTWRTSWIIVCKFFSAMTTDSEIAQRSNHLWTLIHKYPDVDWNAKLITSNPNTTMQVVKSLSKEYIDKFIDFFRLPDVSDFSFEDVRRSFIKGHPLYDHRHKWDWRSISSSANVTMEDIKLYHKKYKWDLTWVCANPNITMDFILRIVRTHPRRRRGVHARLFENPAITMNDIRIYLRDNIRPVACDIGHNPNFNVSMIHFYPNVRWDLSLLSATVSSEDFLNNTHLQWDGDGLSQNPNFTMEWLNYDAKFSFDWSYISRNKAVTMETIRENMDRPWKWGKVSKNPNITIEMIRNTMNKPWCWWDVSENSAITMNMVNTNIDLPWNANALLKNPSITLSELEKSSLYVYITDLIYLLYNPNMTWKNIIKLPHLIKANHELLTETF